MATTLQVISTTPYTTVFQCVSTDDTLVVLQKSGATGNNLDLTSLAMGPLRAYLQRLTNWGVATPGGVTPSGNTRVRWRVSYSNDTFVIPVEVSPEAAIGMRIGQYGQVAIEFMPALKAATTMTIEMSFIHSLVR